MAANLLVSTCDSDGDMDGYGANYAGQMAFSAGLLGWRDALLAAADAQGVVALLKDTAFAGATAAQMLPHVHRACTGSTVHQKLRDRSAAWLIANG